MWKRLLAWLRSLFAPAVRPAPSLSAKGFTAPRPDLSRQPVVWLPPEASPFGVRVLDVRPVTLGTLSVSRDPRMAQNAVSYGGEDGSCFATERPLSARRVEATLSFRAPERIVDGALFLPREMEDKWALFVANGELVVVRGWQRRVFLRASLRIEGDALVVGPFEGALRDDAESEAFTVRAVDFILRTHALDLPWPAPLPGDGAPDSLAMFCMAQFGRQAHFAALDPPPRDVPARPLRVMSRLHIGVLRDDVDAVRAALDAGLPVDLRDRQGVAAVQYVKAVGPVLELLVARGADVEAACDLGVRPLMSAVQTRSLPLVAWLLARGVAVDAADARGFTALHRAAEMGEAGIVDALLARGADPLRASAGGHTPASLAEKSGDAALAARLRAARA
jgi:hypothetical protein